MTKKSNSQNTKILLSNRSGARNMSMSYVSQQTPATAHQSFPGTTDQKDGLKSTEAPIFCSRNVSEKDIGEFLAPKRYDEVLKLTRKMGKKAKEVRKGDWKMKTLEKEFAKYELPMNRADHSGLEHDKDRAVFNLMLGLMNETNNGKSADASKRSLGERFLAWIKDTTSVFTGGQQVLFEEMNKAKATMPAPDPSHTSSPGVGTERELHRDPAISERDIRPETVHAPYFDGKQPFAQPAAIATAPPQYLDSQNAQKIQEERAKLSHIASRLVQCLQGSAEQQGEIEFFEAEFVRINQVIQQLESCGLQLPFEFNSLKTEYAEAQPHLDTYKLGKFQKELQELRSSISGVDLENTNIDQINDLENQFKSLLRKAGVINSEEERQNLQTTIKAVIKNDIGALRAGVTATDSLANLNHELADFQFRKSPESIASFSKRMDELMALIPHLPTGKHRTDLLSQASKLEKTFAGIQDEARTQQIKDGFTEIQSKINLLPGCRDEHDKQRLLEKAEITLQAVSSLLEQQRGGASQENLEQLRLFNVRVGEFKKNTQTSAEKMQSAAQGQAEELVEKVETLLKTAEARLSTSENAEKAAPGSHNPRHLGEVQASLTQALDHIAKMEGSDLEAQRDRLQKEYAGLLSRLNSFPGQTSNIVKPSTAPPLPENADQNETSVDKIRDALNAAEAVLDALASNPNSASQDALRTQARSNLEKATQILSKLTDQASKPERAELNARLTSLTQRSDVIETGKIQGQAKSAQDSDKLLQQGVNEFGRQMGAYVNNGDLQKSGFRTAKQNMARLLSELDAPDPAPVRSVAGAQGARQTPPVKQHAPERLELQPVRAASAPGLTSMASNLVSKAEVFRNNFSSADIGLKLSSDKLKPVVISTDIPLSTLPRSVQTRIINACLGKVPEKVSVVQAYVFADKSADFDGASFNLTLETTMVPHVRDIYKSNRDGKNYYPMEADVLMPEGLQRNAEFYLSSWALHNDLSLKDYVKFAHGPGDKRASHKQDIGFSQMKQLLMELGADAKTASSIKAGYGIPFGFELRQQSIEALNQLIAQNQKCGHEQTDGTGKAEGKSAIGRFERLSCDGDVADCPSSGINPVALDKVSHYRAANNGHRATEICVTKVGILCVRTVSSGIEGVKNGADLMSWVENQKINPDAPELPLIL
ncbi:hypothetical protein [Endozoicomonas sp. SCSIO W0465]|uniref:hypothetical protein n=1 Tax=Endozoicomonas sp. SCSIO W0465 TaxID=2918516 RepID=UPI0020759F86|nr:hypothetical protein [Endozoicomonas sp. SCSIO W0465]USE34790.1 hypothetical protein MJO57_22060 [Endozoicomonas sp. SCSIO W0465]